jgi:hypothetical protein
MLHVRWLLRTPISRFFERCISASSIVLPKKFRKNRAWCGNSMLQLKKKATPLSSTFDDGITRCVFAATSSEVNASRANAS